jgi:hypothetical protein
LAEKDNLMKLKKILFTAMMLAFLIGVQFVTRSLGQFVTGALVNLVLLVTVFTVGLGGGLVVAVASNALAFLAGIGPALPQVIPFVAAANAILVGVAYLVRRQIAEKGVKNKLLAAAGLLGAGAAKTLFLWVGLVLIALPLLPGIKEPQMAVLGAAFTWPQLVTSLSGGALAMLVMPLLRRAVKGFERA